MAFASVQTSALTPDSGSNKLAHVITMPSGIAAGDHLVCVFSADTNPTVSTTSTGWVVLAQALNGTIVRGAVLEKKSAAGDASDNLTVDISISERATAITYRISPTDAAIPTQIASANGSSTNSNPPSLATGTARDWLWIATRSGDTTVVASAAPANYTPLLTQAGNGTSSASTNAAVRQLNAATEDPGVFTSANEQWVCFTVAVAPAGGPTIIEADGASAGVATVASVAAAIWNVVTAAAGIAASTVVGAALWLSVAAAPGVATGAATGATVLQGVGAAAGVAASVVSGAIVAASVASSAGVAVGSAEGADGATGGQGVASGVATASAIGAATVGSPASAAGTSTVLASGATITPSAGASVGTATAQAAGVDANAGSNALASGTAQASAVSGVTTGSVASASGVATVAGVADAPPAVESGSGGRARFRPSRRFSRATLQIGMPSPTVLVRAWTVAPPHATLAVRWHSPIVDAHGRSIPAYRVIIDASLAVHLGLQIDARTEPPTFDMTDEELLFLAARWFDA